MNNCISKPSRCFEPIQYRWNTHIILIKPKRERNTTWLKYSPFTKLKTEDACYLRSINLDKVTQIKELAKYT